MGRKASTLVLHGELLDEQLDLTLEEFCLRSRVSAQRLVELVELGVVEPKGKDPESWRFQGPGLSRVCLALRLERDLGINSTGVALALDLLDELQRLRERLARLPD